MFLLKYMNKLEYNDSREASAEFMRLALPLMSRHQAALHPITYAIWYEYVSGRTAALRTDIDAVTATGRLLDEELVNLLFRKYLADADRDMVEDVNKRLHDVLGTVSGSAQKSYDDADAYSNALEGFSQTLSAGPEASMLQRQIELVLRHTQDIKASMGDLREGLASSRFEVEQLRQELSVAREQAMRDALTGLANRRAFDKTFFDLVSAAAAESHPLSVVVIDIDHFKRVNDRHGHVLGDRVLCAVAGVLKSTVKGKDFAARYGGEEFVVVLPDTPLGGGQTVAEEIRKAVSKGRIRRQDSESPVGQVTVSAGVACLQREETAEALFGRADSAMYESKRTGRNKVTLAW